MPVGLNFDIRLRGRAKIHPPPDIPMIWIKSKQAWAHRVGHCLHKLDERSDGMPVLCEAPIFSYNAADKVDRCHKHSSNGVFARVKG